jgi:hypothetical protein
VSRLELIRERNGGPRHHLDGEPIHCGTGLELLLPGGVWKSVRYEVAGWVQGMPVPVLYMSVGGSWESWRPPAGLREGDYQTVPCDGWDDEKGCTKDDDCACSGRGTREREVAAPTPHQVVLHDVGACELRWPRRGS